MIFLWMLGSRSYEYPPKLLSLVVIEQKKSPILVCFAAISPLFFRVK